MNRNHNKNSRLVYSTETGTIKPKASEAKSANVNGIIRVRNEVKGRRGKTVTVINGFDQEESQLKLLASKLKRKCGCGGTVKDRNIIIQGDKRSAVKSYLEEWGFKVK
jgi:translation initiation factor 1